MDKKPRKKKMVKKDHYDKFHDKKRDNFRPRTSQMVQQDNSVTLEEVQVEKEKLTEGTTKEEEKITKATGWTTGQMTDKEEEVVGTKAVLSASKAV